MPNESDGRQFSKINRWISPGPLHWQFEASNGRRLHVHGVHQRLALLLLCCCILLAFVTRNHQLQLNDLEKAVAADHAKAAERLQPCALLEKAAVRVPSPSPWRARYALRRWESKSWTDTKLTTPASSNTPPTPQIQIHEMRFTMQKLQ